MKVWSDSRRVRRWGCRPSDDSASMLPAKEDCQTGRSVVIGRSSEAYAQGQLSDGVSSGAKVGREEGCESLYAAPKRVKNLRACVSLTVRLTWRGVFLNRLFSTTVGTASRFSSITCATDPNGGSVSANSFGAQADATPHPPFHVQITLALAHTLTARMPSLSLSSLRSEIPSIFLSFTISAIFSSRAACQGLARG